MTGMRNMAILPCANTALWVCDRMVWTSSPGARTGRRTLTSPGKKVTERRPRRRHRGSLAVMRRRRCPATGPRRRDLTSAPLSAAADGVDHAPGGLIIGGGPGHEGGIDEPRVNGG